MPHSLTKTKMIVSPQTDNTSLEELRIAYNKVDSISELTRFLWKRIEEHERVNSSFKDKEEMCVWVRHNIDRGHKDKPKSEIKKKNSLNFEIWIIHVGLIGRT